jgi:hypothetical protein
VRVGIEEGKEMEKRSWENRKGREISEAGIDLNNTYNCHAHICRNIQEKETHTHIYMQ